uniref:SPK domain-containing protein n=1 Tax=Caenorhabditis tropicalis TaxID=1561998 RepID=A0A1I7V0S9_9PELO
MEFMEEIRKKSAVVEYDKGRRIIRYSGDSLKLKGKHARNWSRLDIFVNQERSEPAKKKEPEQQAQEQVVRIKQEPSSSIDDLSVICVVPAQVVQQNILKDLKRIMEKNQKTIEEIKKSQQAPPPSNTSIATTRDFLSHLKLFTSTYSSPDFVRLTEKIERAIQIKRDQPPNAIGLMSSIEAAVDVLIPPGAR